MYRTNNPYQLEFEDFYLPFGGKLRSDNRWIILSKQIPWQEIEQQYSALFADSGTGNRFMPTTSIERVRIVVTAKIKGFVFRVHLLAGPDR